MYNDSVKFSVEDKNLVLFLLPKPNTMELQIIQSKIYEIRGQRVMLDFDLAELYGVETKAFNQAVKRNINRFPDDFMFQLIEKEWGLMWSQIVTSSRKHRGKSYLPYAFTEHGVTMLASILRSEKAVNMSISVVRAFIALKHYVIQQKDITRQLREIRDRLGEHDVQLDSIYDAIENLLDEKTELKKWQDRERIGFKK
jgi:phage regulator Rha-like protein